MSDGVEICDYNSIEGAAKLPDRDLVELFVYYLTVELGLDGCSALDVSGCFTDCDLRRRRE